MPDNVKIYPGMKMAGPIASRPSTKLATLLGWDYFATDEDKRYFCDGDEWLEVAMGEGLPDGLTWGTIADGETLVRDGDSIVGAAGGGSGDISDPTDIDGCQLWLDASQLDLEDDDPVATWPDLSGNGYDATQSNAGLRPTFKTSILGTGLHVVRFDPSGSADALQLTGAALNLLRNKPGGTLVALYRFSGVDADSDSAVMSVWKGDGSDYTRLALFAGDANGRAYGNAARLDGDAVSQWDVPTNLNDIPSVHCLCVNADWSKRAFHVRSLDLMFGMVGMQAVDLYGSQSAYGDGTAGNSSDTASSAIVIGSTDAVGPDGGYPFGGDIAEIVVYDRSITAVEWRRLADYFATKWGLS